MNLLEKIKEKQVTSVEGVMLSERDEENALAIAGFRHVLERNKTRREEFSVLRKYGPLVRLEDILKIGKKYGMKFDLAERFKGDPGPDTARRVHEFMRTHGLSKSDTREEIPRREVKVSRFRILGPVEFFEKPLPVDLDPVLFYKVSDDLYALIDQWGGDLHPLRAVTTFLKEWRGTICMISIAGLVFGGFALHSGAVILAAVVPVLVGLHRIFTWANENDWDL